MTTFVDGDAQPRFVKFDKSTDGVEVGVVSFTMGKTSSWYAESVADFYHDYHGAIEAAKKANSSPPPLQWSLDTLILCGHGSVGGNGISNDTGVKVKTDEIAAFVKTNMIKLNQVLVNCCHGADSGGKPGNAFADKLGKALGVPTFGAIESINRLDNKGKFYNATEYHWRKFDNGVETDLGVHNLQQLLRFVLHGIAMNGDNGATTTLNPTPSNNLTVDATKEAAVVAASAAASSTTSGTNHSSTTPPSKDAKETKAKETVSSTSDTNATVKAMSDLAIKHSGNAKSNHHRIESVHNH